MELVINRVGIIGNTKTTAKMTHKGQELLWDVAVIDKTSYKETQGEFDIFEQINGYWQQQPAEVQDRIFDVYVRIKNAFGSIWVMEDLTRVLHDLVAELLSHHDLDKVLHYLSFHSNIRIPDGLKDSFKESFETPGTRERTYLKEDYRWLVAMTVALRAMTPVWGEFINRTEDEYGTTYKEYFAAKLLAKSNILHTKAWEKLQIFVEHSIPTDKSKTAAILDGVSSEDFPFWILGLVVVRRLSVGDVRGVDPQASLVTFIYKYIGQKVKGHDNSFMKQGMMVKEKTIEGQGQEGENNLSKLEGYKIKQEIPAGDIAILRHYIRDVYALASSVSPSIDLRLVDQSLESVRVMETEQLWKPQIMLTQWILKPVIQPRGLMHLEKKAVLEAMAVAQALLWSRGYFELAGLLTAIAQPSDSTMSLTGTSQRHRVPKELVEELNVLYPFVKRTGKVAKPGKPTHTAAALNIELMEKMFSEHDWRLTLPAEWVAQLTGNPNNRRYSVPPDIKVRLAQLVIAIAKRAF